MKTGLEVSWDPTRPSDEARELETALRHQIVGQDPAVEKVAEIHQMFLAGLNPAGRAGWEPAVPGGRPARTRLA